MKKILLFLSFLFLSGNAAAVEPVLDHQGMIYFNVSFDAGHSSKTEHDFGFRFDRALVKPGENLTMNQLVNKPAVFNLKYNSNGLKAFELNGIDYSYIDYVNRGAEGGAKTGAEEAAEEVVAEAEPAPEETTVEQPKREIKIPLGVIIGTGIALIAIGGSAQ